MAEFDRSAVMVAALDAASPSEINRITELRVDGGVHFDPIMEEVREAVRAALDEGGEWISDAGDAVAQANIITGNDGDRLAYFEVTQAAHDVSPGEVSYDESASSLEFVSSVLEHVFTEGVQKLMDHLDAVAEEAERNHDDEEEDEAHTSGNDPDDWV